MTDSDLVELMRQAILTGLLVIAPVLLAGFGVALVTGLMQAATGIHDIHAGQSAPAILDPPRNHLIRQARCAGDVPAQQGGIEVGSDGVDVVEKQPAEIWPLGQERPQHAIAQHVGDLVPVPHGVKALEREVVGVVASFAGRLRPGEQLRMRPISDVRIEIANFPEAPLFPGKP